MTKRVVNAVAALVVAMLFTSTVFAQQYTGKVKGKKAEIGTQIVVGDGVDKSTITGTGFVGIGSGLLNLTPGNLSAGILPSNVQASSVALSGFYSDDAVRANLGLAIGTNVQAWNANLDTLATNDGSNLLKISSVAVNSIYPQAVQSGTYGIAITGNAGSVTNGVYTTGNQSIDGVKTFTSQIQGSISGSAASITGNINSSQINAGALPSNVYVSSYTQSSVTNDALAGSISDTKLNQITSDNKVAVGAIAAGALPSDVIASSIAVNAVYTNAILNGAVTDDKINSVSATKLTGTIDNERLDDSSVTLQGNTFNGASQLVKLDATGKLPAVDGSQLTNLNPSAVTHYRAFGGYNGALGAGTTFFAMTPDQNVTLARIQVTVVSAGEGGSTGAVFKCGTTASNALSVTVPAESGPGTIVTATGSVSVTSGTPMKGWMDSSDEDITPSANVVCSFF